MSKPLSRRECAFVLASAVALLAGYMVGRADFNVHTSLQAAKAGAADHWPDRALKAEKRLIELGDPQTLQEHGIAASPAAP